MKKVKTWLVTALVVSFVFALGLVADTSSAVADEPTKYEVAFTVSDELTNFCPFPIAITLNISGFAIDHVDKDGVLTRTFAHSVEQDTFSANGKTLVGLPYTVNMQFIFDSDGNLVHQIGTGIYERVPLPDGSMFLSAGRADFVANGVSVILSPDKGNPGNVAAFCAALAP